MTELEELKAAIFAAEQASMDADCESARAEAALQAAYDAVDETWAAVKAAHRAYVNYKTEQEEKTNANRG